MRTCLRRPEFIAGLGGATAAWAQELRGVLMADADDALGRTHARGLLSLPGLWPGCCEPPLSGLI
jgi:hypothetical protein